MTRLEGVDGRLEGVDERLKWHGEMLRVHRDHFDSIEATQAKHTEMLREHGDKLKEHDGRFDRIEATLAAQGHTLKEHGRCSESSGTCLSRSSPRSLSATAAVRDLRPVPALWPGTCTPPAHDQLTSHTGSP